MTAPNMLTQYKPRRRRTGAMGSPGGDGNYDANGVMSQPGQTTPGQQTTGPSQYSAGSPSGLAQPPQQQRTNPDPMGTAANRGGGPPPTFAQMQSQGMARPAPQTVQPQGGSIGGQLQQSVQQALQNPSRYDLPQVQQVRSALQGQLEQQFGGQRKQLDEEMSRRGLSASTIGSGYYGDLAGQQSSAMANLDAQLMQNYAATQAQDLSASLGAGQNYENAFNERGLAQGKLNLDTELGRGGLGVQQGQLGLAEKLGLGNMDLEKQRLAQSGEQFGQSLAEQRAGREQSGQQFGQTLAEQIAGRQQAGNQFGQTLAEQIAGREQSGNQFSQNLAEQQAGRQQEGNQFKAQLGETAAGRQQQNQQFMDQLAQQLGISTMSDKTANRGIDTQDALAKNELMMKIMQLMGNVDFSQFTGQGLTPAQQAATNTFNNGQTATGGTPANPYTNRTGQKV